MTGPSGVGHGYQGGPLTAASAVPRLIDRGDFVVALDRAATRKMTVISAPVGKREDVAAARLPSRGLLLLWFQPARVPSEQLGAGTSWPSR
jgi:hypothetical protein